MNNRRSQSGQSLAELVVVLVITASMLVVAGTAADSAHNRIALAASTSELRATMQRVRLLAVAHNRNVAIRFRQDGAEWTWAVYEDGDGDGVRNNDIAAGIDREIEPPRKLTHRPARVGVPAGVKDPMNGQLLSARPPIRFGAPMLCSFSPQGEATTGSLVVTDGKRAAIIRIEGDAARVNVYWWNGKKWTFGV